MIGRNRFLFQHVFFEIDEWEYRIGFYYDKD